MSNIEIVYIIYERLNVRQFDFDNPGIAHHPYYLQSSDNPDIELVTQTLTAQNYQKWSRSFRLALFAK